MSITYKILTFFLLIKTQVLVLFGKKKVLCTDHELMLNYKDFINNSNFTNGWYVTERHSDYLGQDPDKLCYFDSSNAKVDNIRLYKSSNYIPVWKYSGVMKHSEIDFLNGFFTIEIKHDFTKNAKFAFWLKDTIKDVNEIDIVEIHCKQVITLFGKKYTKATFTVHGGKSYATDHWFISNSIWINENSHEFSLLRTKNTLSWYVDGYLTMVTENPHKFSNMSLIMELSNKEELGCSSSICQINKMEAFVDV